MTESNSNIRTCRYCNLPKPLDQFPLTRGKRFWKCKTCSYHNSQKWAEEKRAQSNTIKRRYFEKNKEKIKESQRRYYTSPEGRSVSRAWKNRNKEEINARYRQQYENDPTPFIVRNKRREERDKQVGGAFTTEDRSALFQIQRGLCANPYCKTDLAVTGFHADHKTPVIRGGSHGPENRQLLCPKCNHQKGTRTHEEWIIILAQEHKSEAI